MVNRDVLVSRVEKIDLPLNKINGYRKISLKDYLVNESVQDVVEYNLFQIVNHIIDIVEHIVVDEDYGLPESAYDAVQILISKKAIDVKTGKLLRKMIGVRNIIAHEYINLQKDIIHDILSKHLPQIRSTVTKLLRKYL